MSDRYKFLEGYEFSGGAVLDANTFAIWGQKWPPDPDPMEIRPVGVFFHYANKPEGQRWAFSGMCEASGVYGAVSFDPKRLTGLLMDDGEFYVVGGGVAAFERKIPGGIEPIFTRLKSIQRGPFHAVGRNRTVFRRDAPDTWVPLLAGLDADGPVSASGYRGFSDIDGFDPVELYACGGNGDLWRFDGVQWHKIDSPTNALLRSLVCAERGEVYITTNAREIVAGRHDAWRMIRQDATRDIFESIVDFNGAVLIATVSAIYEVKNDTLVPASLGAEPPMRSRAHLAAGCGHLLVVGRDEATVFDGTSWRVLLTPAP